jgi:hypothetical protein
VEPAFPTLKRGTNEHCASGEDAYAAINKARVDFAALAEVRAKALTYQSCPKKKQDSSGSAG